MSSTVTFKFDAGLDYQLEAIESVTDLFEGLPPLSANSSVVLHSETGDMGMIYNEFGVGNCQIPSSEAMLANLQKVQRRHNIPVSRQLVEEGSPYPFPNFSIEMETGTGKTYVYLRTIFELNRLCGYKKFIIVVPSVAIREGVTASIRAMSGHFSELYDNQPFSSFVYSSKNLSNVRQFAASNPIQIMVINIQAFQKDAGENTDYDSLTDEEKKKLNVIHQDDDRMSGRRPIEFIQATNPIVIIDEPQSVDTTDKSRRAIRTLNPLFCLRYSATHVMHYNLLYQLDPVKAYDMKLVKQIEVIDAAGGQDFYSTFIRLDSVFYPKNAKTPKAKITVFQNSARGAVEKQITVKHGDDLGCFTDRPDYDGNVVTNISAEDGNTYIEFNGSVTIGLAEEQDGAGDERMKSQIEQTITAHFDKEKRFKDRNIKVLSLFFIDHVKSYRSYDENGTPVKGKIALWFEETYERIRKKEIYRGCIPWSAGEVHDGYFSSDRKKGKIVEELDTSGGTTKDDDTYRLIMQDKERLLSPDVPLRFIFSHSALREGWDNPNVFQICTLREMGTDRERRQTIGRGLRLPVDSLGNRIYDEQVNRLTVVANETFESFAKGLQSDIETAIDPDGNFRFGRIPPLAFTRVLNSEGTDYLTQEQSKEIWGLVAERGFIDADGGFTQTFRPSDNAFSLGLPEQYRSAEADIIARMKAYLPRDFVKDSRTREKLRYNKRIEELNEDFRTLWDKIKVKTRYSVEFKTDDLVSRAADKIRNMQSIGKVRIDITVRDLDIKEFGLEGGAVRSPRIHLVQNSQPLPDILEFLQRETELTRGTLVRILTECGRLNDFAVNPQMFMTEAAKQIRYALNELIVDGIKYEPVPGQYYDMMLFEKPELEEYLSRLYKVQHTDECRTPYNFIPFDSSGESEMAEMLDNDTNVKFFCKLPRWFKIPTPLGTYNPDWAVVAGEEHKLYLICETKSTLDADKRRGSENAKIRCGRAHFESLKCELQFREATTIHELYLIDHNNR